MVDSRNPFELGPKVGRATTSPDLRSRVGAFRAPVQTGPSGTEIVSALVGFAGVAGSIYVEQTAKKLEEDKIVQSTLAMEGYMPTDDATVAGYQAHVAVAVKGQTMGAQARLNELAKTNIDDEVFEEAVREEYRQQDEFLTENYPTYAESIELQKLAAVSMREMMPQVGMQRAASKVGFEIEGRVNAATDVFVNAAASGQLVGQDPKDVLAVANGMVESLQLTASQKDNALEDAIVNSKEPALVELAKSYKGDRSTSLYQRSGKIQQIANQNFKDEMARKGLDMVESRQALNDMYLGTDQEGPTMTQQELKSFVQQQNKLTGGDYMSDAQYAKLLNDRRKVDSAAYKQANIITSLTDENVTGLSSYKKSEVQGAIGGWVNTTQRKAEEEADKLGLTGMEKQKFIETANQTSQKYIADSTVRVNSLYDVWVDDFSSLANSNVDAQMREVEGTGGARTFKLSAKASETIKLARNMSPVTFNEYAEKAGKKQGRIMKRLLSQFELGKNEADAVASAQRNEEMRLPVNSKEVDKAVLSITDNAEAWLKTDIPDNQREFLQSLIRQKVMNEPVPSSKQSQKMITSWLEEGFTITESGMRLQGSASQLHELSNVTVQFLDPAMDEYKAQMAEQVAPSLRTLGLTMDDVFVQTDVTSGYMTLGTANGAMRTTRIPISRMNDLVNQGVARNKKKIADNIEKYHALEGD